MTAEEIFKTMQDLIAEQFAIDADEISMESSFVDDLGADSVDLVELVMAICPALNCTTLGPMRLLQLCWSINGYLPDFKAS